MIVETKTSYYLTILALSLSTFLTYLWINHISFYLLTLLIVIDIITWMLKGVLHKDLKSKSLFIWIISKLVFLTIPLVFGITLKINWFTAEAFLSMIFFLMSFWELYSIIWNFYEIKTWKKQKEFDAIDYVYKNILSIIKKELEKKIDKQIENKQDL